MPSGGSPRILFLSSHYYIPQSVGGMARSTHELCLEFLAEGAQPMVAAHVEAKGLTWVVSRIRSKLEGTQFPCSMRLGYPVYRGYCLSDHIDDVLRHSNPDCVCIQSPRSGPLVERMKSSDMPVFVYLRDNELETIEGNPAEWSWVRFIANSKFTRDFFQRQCGVSSTVVYPLINRKEAVVDARGDQILFINPVADKGLNLALRLARRLPNYPFLFQESWRLNGQKLESLRRELRGCPNVSFQHKVTDRAQFYGKARLLIVPSRWQEAFGRVAIEAQMSGIPVVASNRGGLPEAVGEGGVIVSDLENEDEWCDAITQLMEDRDHHRKMSAAAIQNASRPDLGRDHIIGTLLDLFDGRA